MPTFTVQNFGFLFLTAASSMNLEAAGSGQIVDLAPSRAFSLSQAIDKPAWQQMIVREMRATSDGFWFLADSKVQKGLSAVIRTNLNGGVAAVVSATSGTSFVGLTVTARGAATLVVKPHAQALLTEFSPSGSQVTQVAVSCYASEHLITIGGKPSTICGDGLITTYDGQHSPVQTTSWARPGSKFELIGDHFLGIIDRATLQILINDLSTNTIATGPGPIPEFTTALTQASVQRQSAQSQSSSAPMGAPALAMATAADTSAWYVLLYPYSKSVGPAVVKLDASGEAIARYRCHITADIPSLTQMDVQNGYIVLGSVYGDIFRYRQQ